MYRAREHERAKWCYRSDRLRGVKQAISDAHEGLEAAAAKVPRLFTLAGTDLNRTVIPDAPAGAYCAPVPGRQRLAMA